MSDNNFLDYYKRMGYKFFPGDNVIIEINGRTRPAEIGAPYELQDRICYNGRYLDNGGKEYFIDIPEELIIPSENKSS